MSASGISPDQVSFSLPVPGRLTSLEVRCRESKGLDKIMWHLVGESSHRGSVRYGEVPSGMTEKHHAEALKLEATCGVFAEVRELDDAIRKSGIVFLISIVKGVSRVEEVFDSVKESDEYVNFQTM
jgi:hypothetical protein